VQVPLENLMHIRKRIGISGTRNAGLATHGAEGTQINDKRMHSG
jgi:hypothetical protein